MVQQWNSGRIDAVNTGQEFLPHSSGHGAPSRSSGADPKVLFTQNQTNVLPTTRDQSRPMFTVSAAFLFDILYTAVRNDVEMRKSNTVASVLRDWEIFTPVV
jgi:hypothetical protein